MNVLERPAGWGGLAGSRRKVKLPMKDDGSDSILMGGLSLSHTHARYNKIGRLKEREEWKIINPEKTI